MKAILGLVVAIFLGALGFVLNMVYLNDAGAMKKTESFLGVRVGAEVEVGEKFTEKMLDRVELPQDRVGNLHQFAFLYSDRGTVVGERAARRLDGGELILRSDLRTPPPEINLKDGEIAVGVPIDVRQFIPALIVPGKTPVSFMLPSSTNPEEWEPLGPFEVLSVGNRLGTPETMKAKRTPQTHENVLIIRVTPTVKAKANKLQDHLRRTNDRPLDVVLHPRVTR